MKIGILTFHASHNFGSMLQNYALQQFLIAEGHTVETINLRTDKQRYMYNYPLCIGLTSPSLLVLCGRFRKPRWLINECRRWHLFERFLKDHLFLSKEFKDWHSIKQSLAQLNYDVIITGGDQIWNPVCYDFDWSYYLPDSIAPIKKISYSPSFGNSVPVLESDGEWFLKMRKCLEDYDFVSVREKDASDYLRGLMNRDIPVIADPTILLTASDYVKLIGDPIIREPYIYYYTPLYVADPDAEKIAVGLAKKLGLKIITSFHRFKKRSSMNCVMSGPIEFLNLINNARLVMGKSYHLVIFSMLFHKDFITVNCDADERMKSLLQRLGITDRNMNRIEDYDSLKCIDFRQVDDELCKMRKDATSFLEGAFSHCCQE